MAPWTTGRILPNKIVFKIPVGGHETNIRLAGPDSQLLILHKIIIIRSLNRPACQLVSAHLQVFGEEFLVFHILMVF